MENHLESHRCTSNEMRLWKLWQCNWRWCIPGLYCNEFPCYNTKSEEFMANTNKKALRTGLIHKWSNNEIWDMYHNTTFLLLCRLMKKGFNWNSFLFFESFVLLTSLCRVFLSACHYIIQKSEFIFFLVSIRHFFIEYN